MRGWIDSWGIRCFIVALLLWASFCGNSKWLRDHYGDGGGRWEDAIDSYSEYLVRNKLKNELLGSENRGWFLILCSGYPQGDYSFLPKGTEKYFSNCGHQVWILVGLAHALQIRSESGLDRLIRYARMANALGVALSLSLFLMRLSGGVLSLAVWGSVGVIAGSVGLIQFSQNLYYCLSLLFLPLGLGSLMVGRVPFRLLLAVEILMAYAYFSRGYEFATVYSLGACLPLLAFSGGRSFLKTLVECLCIIGATILGFIAVAGTHVLLVRLDQSVGWGEALGIAFSTVRMRTLSFEGVPPPFSLGFVGHMRSQWLAHGLIVPPIEALAFQIPKIMAVVALGCFVFFRRVHLGVNGAVFIGWAMITYASWYAVAYQHMIHHRMFDGLLFGFSFSLAASCVLLRCGQGNPHVGGDREAGLSE